MIFVITCICMGIAVWLSHYLIITVPTNRMVAEFKEMFPGRCMICSMHRYGIEMGFEKYNTSVVEHFCIEKVNDD